MSRSLAMTRVRDRLLRPVARLSELAATPLVPADYLELFDRLQPTTYLRARIVSIDPETRDAATLVLQPGRGWRPHLPGQYVRLGVDVDGVRHWRSYSLTSRPDRSGGCISVTVKAIDGGTVSSHLVRRARPGMVVQLELPAGDFVLPTPPPPRTLFVAAGSGITPVMGMLRSRLDDLDDVVVLHASRSPEEAIFGGELRALASRGRLRLIEQHSARDGRLDPARLAELVPDLDDRDTWACGPTGLLDALEARWSAAGRAAQLHTERFRPKIVEPGQGGTVRFTSRDVEVEADGATSLLDAGEAANVLMPSGCRMGICFGCVLPLREGAVRDLRSGKVTLAVPGDEPPVIQTCINAAAGPCHLDV